jgi:hypothetical protein
MNTPFLFLVLVLLVFTVVCGAMTPQRVEVTPQDAHTTFIDVEDGEQMSAAEKLLLACQDGDRTAVTELLGAGVAVNPHLPVSGWVEEIHVNVQKIAVELYCMPLFAVG